MIGDQVFRLPIQRHKTFKSLTPQDTSEPLHEIGKILCNKDSVYTPSMWAAYFEEWVNSNRQPKGYVPRGAASPPLSANLEESILAAAEAEVAYCSYTDDLAEYLRGKYGLFPHSIWADIVHARREMLDLICDAGIVICSSHMRLYDGSYGERESTMLIGATQSGAHEPMKKAWSRYWPATHGNQVPTYNRAPNGAQQKQRSGHGGGTT